MIRDMKFEDSSLTGYLVKNLESLTEADPLILAKYVEALLKKDKPVKELQKLCAENLVEFLGQGTESFITKLFQALEDGSIVVSGENSDAIKQVEPPNSFISEDPIERKISSPNTEGLSPSSCHASDTEEKEFSDDDDDDRNHKHRRRETRSQSFDKYGQEQLLSRPNRKRNKPFENGQLFLEGDPQSSEVRKQYNPTPPERDFSAKFEKRRPSVAALSRPPLDLGQRTKVNPPLRGDPGTRFDLSSVGRLPIGRGRGRSSGPWNQHDSRFSSVDTLDFASQMAPQGPTPGLFPGRGLPNAANTQNASWGAFGLIPGMSNGALDTLHPLGLQGTLRSPSLNIGMPRQRCRDFEERGFCLRGDMCPMEHGVNRIVVEDVQSLSQFNLPVSLPSACLLGMPAGTGPLPSVSAPNLFINSKNSHGKSGKSGAADDGLNLNGVLPVSAGSGEADLYDPDQPLWNTDRPETSSALLKLPSTKIHEAETLWDNDASDCHNLRLADGIDSGRSITTNIGSQSATSSVWGRIRNSGNKLEMSGKNDSTITSTSYFGNEVKDLEEGLPAVPINEHQEKQIVTDDIVPKAMNSSAAAKRSDPARNAGRTSQKASRTLFVNCIPLKNNKREALLSHFQKFGEVIDIYIPVNSEKAFVQFSKREEAEAAVKAPDAVMGNRFIKLWWANRDNIPDDGISSGNTVSAAPRGMTAASTPLLSSIAEIGKENLLSAASKVSASVAPDVPAGASVNPKPVVTNGAKSTAHLQKKLESLELLKEELRIKQEMLDQKRNDFRRQLDKLEKQATTVKPDAVAEQAIKRHKVGPVTPAKIATPRSSNPSTTGTQPTDEKTIDSNNSGDIIASPNSKTGSSVVLQSPRSLKQPSRSLAPVGPPFFVNRFKLDNRPTTFRILPPLPADFANVAVLKEHFSIYGDLSAVELEGSTDTHTGTDGSGPSKNCSARVTFTTRRSAERAFGNGKCWQGHNLQFVWVTLSSNTNSDHGRRENSPAPTPRGIADAEIPTKNVSSACSLSSTGKPTNTVSKEAPAVENEESKDLDGISGSVDCMELVEACQSSSAAMASCEERSPKEDILIVEDDQTVRSEDIGNFNTQLSHSMAEGV
ncbi:PREDICTED: zinc finger CCCH domain-containing protein 27 [Nelumbo nucifera]|uniref:Zinc finger CCCH domain-containing protein 27-like n=2 Tax=Nelumbo nucifera TaxID=4432 RepID=A0A822YE79_NELNU|nr:PREDICTED: zinc finger CCCH domain-containing protein 27 [Nelumbo nucifera]DAD30850.1 TPA_asm: hypothetical protein HUJ06_009701 [Nelumbo nucifera]